MISQDLFDASLNQDHTPHEIMPIMPESTPPELIVLEQLKQTCEQVRRHNSNPEVAKAALNWELKILNHMDKLGGAEREPVRAA